MMQNSGIRLLWFVVILVGSLISSPVSAEPFRIGAMRVGSGWYVAAASMEKNLEAVLPGLDFEVVARGGGVANPMVVQQGKAQLAISNVATSLWASKGQLLYNGKKASDIRSLVGGLNPVFIGAIVRNDFLKKNGFSTLKDIFESGKPVNIMMKPPGSFIPPAVDIVLKAHGLSREKIEANGGKIYQVAPSQMSSLIRDGRVDLYFDSILRGHPTIQEISLTGGVVFLDLSEEAAAALSEYGIRKENIPRWFDAAQNGSTVGGNFGTQIIAHKSLPEEIAYKITKALIENMDKIAVDFPAWKAFVPENVALPENNGIALHPGAIRYYEERGWL